MPRLGRGEQRVTPLHRGALAEQVIDLSEVVNLFLRQRLGLELEALHRGLEALAHGVTARCCTAPLSACDADESISASTRAVFGAALASGGEGRNIATWKSPATRR